MADTIESRIRDIASAVLEVRVDELNENSSQDTTANWDSLNHMKLIVALEEEYGVQFTDDEILNMQSLKVIKSVLEKYLINK